MGRRKGSKNKPKEVVGPFNGDKLQEEFDEVFKPENLIQKIPETVVSEIKITRLQDDPDFIKGTLIVTDPIVAAGLSRASVCASSKKETPFPDDWDKMGKIARLEWLTAHPRKK